MDRVTATCRFKGETIENVPVLNPNEDCGEELTLIGFSVFWYLVEGDTYDAISVLVEHEEYGRGLRIEPADYGEYRSDLDHGFEDGAYVDLNGKRTTDSTLPEARISNNGVCYNEDNVILARPKMVRYFGTYDDQALPAKGIRPKNMGKWLDHLSRPNSPRKELRMETQEANRKFLLQEIKLIFGRALANKHASLRIAVDLAKLWRSHPRRQVGRDNTNYLEGYLDAYRESWEKEHLEDRWEAHLKTDPPTYVTEDIVPKDLLVRRLRYHFAGRFYKDGSYYDRGDRANWVFYHKETRLYYNPSSGFGPIGKARIYYHEEKYGDGEWKEFPDCQWICLTDMKKRAAKKVQNKLDLVWERMSEEHRMIWGSRENLAKVNQTTLDRWWANLLTLEELEEAANLPD